MSALICTLPLMHHLQNLMHAINQNVVRLIHLCTFLPYKIAHRGEGLAFFFFLGYGIQHFTILIHV